MCNREKEKKICEKQDFENGKNTFHVYSTKINPRLVRFSQ